jgi:pyruvate carboxylase
LTVHRIEAEMFHAGRQRDEQMDMTWHDQAYSAFFAISQMHLKTRVRTSDLIYWSTTYTTKNDSYMSVKTWSGNCGVSVT